ncbi:MAG: phosphotransferase [Thermomicrobiales bacterium]
MLSLRTGWTDDPNDPGRLAPDDDRVHALIDRIAPGETAIDIGGSFSLNLHLTPSNRVLRIHRRFVSRTRLLAEQALRRNMAMAGIRTPIALSIDGHTIIRTGTGSRRRLAELEPFIAAETPEPTAATYLWLFHELGHVHTVLATFPTTMPRSLAATWGTPSSMRRWFEVTRGAVAGDAAAQAIVDTAQALLPNIRHGWITPRLLPHHHLIHGDFRPGNAVQASGGGNLVVFDTGFADVRPRVWDIAYALGFMQLALGPTSDETTRATMIATYEEISDAPLSDAERAVIPSMSAIALLHTIAHAGFMADPAAVARSQEPFVQAAARIIATS